MYAYINGLVIDKEERGLIVLTQGLGYRIHVPTEQLSKIRVDEKVQLHLHTAVREDDISLYGFGKKEELKFFEQLISVSGIGPKTAMEILSAPLRMVQRAIVEGDSAMLTKVKGLGKKTAERLILELKGKVVPVGAKGEGKGGAAYNEEAVDALVGLGYEKAEVIRVLSQMPHTVKSTEEIVKVFLRQG